MPQSAPQPTDTLSLKPEQVSSASMVLQQLAGRLQQQRADKILDVGPAYQENINFFANRAKQLYVCDLFTRLHQIKNTEKPSNTQIWKELEFPSNHFDCINLWGLLDHLTDEEALKIVQRCKKLVKPYGLVLVIAIENALHPRNSTLFASSPEYRLTLRSLPHIQLPFFYRPNRELISLLEPFKPIKIFRHHNGIREMLFQRSAHSR